MVVNRTPLYFPKELTQKDPNKNKITKRFDLAGPDRTARALNSRAHRLPTAASIRRQASRFRKSRQRRFSLKSRRKLRRLWRKTMRPRRRAHRAGIVAPAAPPPKTVRKSVREHWRRAAAEPAVGHGAADGAGRDTRPHPRFKWPQMAVSDDSLGQNLPAIPGRSRCPGQLGSQVELKSDPQGIDLRPYLAQILAIVRRNWFNVIPESVRMGTRRGRTVLQFILNRDGTLAKVVISDYSGSDPLDRAAVAGLSMSNPLPPLPKEYKGAQMRLALSFNYNQTGATLR